MSRIIYRRNRTQTNLLELVNKFQYCLLIAYVILLYMFDGSAEYSVLMYVPLSIFVIIELGFILKMGRIKVTKYILLVFLFAFICLLSCVWAQYKDLAMNRTITVFLLAIALVFMYNYCTRTNKKVEDILIILLISGTIFSFYIMCFYGIDMLVEVFNNKSIRIGEEINNVNVIGTELAMTAILSFYFGINKSKWFFLLIAVPVIISLGTASKKAIVCIILGVMIVIVFSSKKKKTVWEMIKKIVLPVAFLGVVLLMIEMNVFPALTRRLDYYSNSFSGEGKIDDSTEDRNAFVEYGFSSFLDRPFTGVGVANSGQITLRAAGWETYLHNNYIELLATVGIFGTVVYYIVFIFLLLFAIRNRYAEDALAVITFLMIYLVLDWGAVTYYSKITYIYILLGMIFYVNVKNNYIARRTYKHGSLIEEGAKYRNE